MHTLPCLPSHDYQLLRVSAEVLARDTHGDKVLRLTDGSYLKLFRRKRLISSAQWYPYAARFVDNAESLKKFGICCPEIISAFRVCEINRDCVRYHPLLGLTIRELIADGKGSAELRAALLEFVKKLHDAGIYFRSLHLGNIVLTPDGNFGLIDISDMRIGRRPLSPWQRQRNMRHMLRTPTDANWLNSEGI